MSTGRVFELAFALNATMQGNFSNIMKFAENTMQKLKGQTEQLKFAQKQLSGQWNESQAQIRSYSNQLTTLNESYQRGLITETEFRTEAAKITQAIKQAGVSVEEYRQNLSRIRTDMQKTAMAQKNLTDAIAARKSAFMDYSSAKSNFVSAATSAYMLAQAMSGPIEAAAHFESAMADVRKVVDFDTPAQFKDMQKDILALTRTLPMAGEDLAKIVAAGGQSGIAREDLLSFAESAAKMGVAFDITADQAGEMMAKWKTAFKLGQADVVKLADQINYLGNTTAASAPLISDVVTRIGPLGEIGGVASGEIAALGASMVGAGVNSEIASTGIKNLILSMTAGEAATSRQQEAFAKLGMDAEAMAVKMQTDAKGAILELFQALQSLPKEAQGATLSQLVGRESIAAIAPLLSNLDALKENLDKVTDASKYSGSMQDEFAARCQTAENSLQLMKNAAAEASINIGSALLPVISDAAKSVAEVSGGFAQWASENPSLIKGIAILAAGIMALNLYIKGTLVLSKLWFFAKATWIALTAAQNAAMLTAAASGTRLSMVQKLLTAVQWAWNAAMTANPIGVIIVGIAALIAAGYALYANWDKVKQFFVTLWESPAAQLALFLAGPVGWLIGIVAGIIANWEQVKAWFVLLWNEPGAALDQFVNMVKNKFATLVSYVEDKWERLKFALSNPITATVNMVQTGSVYGNDGPQPPGMASGGFVNHPQLTWLAEGGYPEAVIPLDGTARAMELWQQAGAALGVPTFNQEMPAMRQVAVSTAQTRPEIAIPEINMPEMPEIVNVIPEINMPEMPEIVNVIPEINMPESAPQEIYVPRISVPETYIEAQPTPDITIPEMPFMQQVLPEIAVPAISTARQIPHEANPQVELLSNAADIIHKAASVMRAESTENAILETPVVRSGGSNVNIEFSAPITINGDADNRTVTQIADAAQQMKRQFEDMFRDMMAQQRRVSFA